MSSAHRKLSEAAFFLSHLQREGRKAGGDPNPFRYYLSAFLTAGRSVTDALRKKTPGWPARLPAEERAFLYLMGGERDEEVHRTGAQVEAGEEDIPIYHGYEDESGRWEVAGPPPAAVNMKGPPGTIRKPVRYFHIDGERHEVTEVCKRYLALLKSLVKEIAGEP